ncbi:Amidase family protein SACE_5032 [hydrothermal vent metagenome]|uniref:Amidase family protein SACE_5032 n=1 Tax=hydrothermal vent metagenome TaxID=652676 RepID=A0A3B0RL59_9ZZZZ
MTILPLTAEQTAAELATDIASGKLTSVEATEAAISRIEALDGPINAIVVRDFESARQQARDADARLAKGDKAPLLGVPMTVKESFNVAGFQTCWGVEAAKGNIAEEDAVVVKRLKAAGAVILGKTNIPPMLTDWFADNPVYGRTSNPHDHGRSPGGSSGGGAAAVASGMVACEYGSDIGGSIRVPAHYCGIWGLKPTYSVVSKEGHFPPGTTEGAEGALSVVGPLARSADDLELLFGATVDRPLPKEFKPLDQSHILVITDHPSVVLDDAMRQQIEDLATLLEEAGAQVTRETDLLPDLEKQHQNYMHMLNVTITAGAPRPDGSEVMAGEWLEMCNEQARNQRQWRALFEEFDYALAPVSSTSAFEHDTTPMKDRKLSINGTDYRFAEQLAWAGLVTFPGLPATVLPIGSVESLPVGLQVIADRYQDYKTIDGARQIGALLS